MNLADWGLLLAPAPLPGSIFPFLNFAIKEVSLVVYQRAADVNCGAECRNT